MTSNVSRIRKSTDCAALYEALSAFQGAARNIEKDKHAKIRMKSGGIYEFDYADIAGVLDTTRPTYSKFGLAVVQMPVINGRNMELVTHIAHKSGQWLEGDYPVCELGTSHQDMGAALTYAKRYALTAILAIAADSDTGGGEEGGAGMDTRGAEERAPATSGPPRSTGAGKQQPHGFDAKIRAVEAIPALEAIGREIGAADLDDSERTRLRILWTNRRAAILEAKAEATKAKLPKDMDNEEWLAWCGGVLAEAKTMDELTNAWTVRLEPHFDGRSVETRQAAGDLFNAREKALS